MEEFCLDPSSLLEQLVQNEWAEEFTLDAYEGIVGVIAALETSRSSESSIVFLLIGFEDGVLEDETRFASGIGCAEGLVTFVILARS